MGIKIKKIIKKIRLKRTTVLVIVFIFLSSVLVRQLFSLQIIQGEDYISKFQTRTTKTRVIKSTRGNIYDRNGTVVASNVLAYSVTFEDSGTYNSTREKNLTLNGIAYQVLQILSKNGDSLSDNFHITVNDHGDYAFDVDEGFTLNRFRADIYGEAQIDDLSDEQKNATAAQIMDHLTGSSGFSIVLYGKDAYTPEELAAHSLPEELTKQEILEIAIMRYQLNTNSFKKYMPVTIATNVSEKSVAAIKENQAALQGIDIVEDSTRKYVDDESMARSSVTQARPLLRNWKPFVRIILIIPMMRLLEKPESNSIWSLNFREKTEKKRSQLIILVKSLTLTILKLLILWPETMFI